MKTAIALKRRRGECVGQIPYGWRRKGPTVIAQPGEQKILRLLLSLRRRGMTYRAIASVLCRRCVAPAKPPARWHARTGQSILSRHARARQAAMLGAWDLVLNSLLSVVSLTRVATVPLVSLQCRPTTRPSDTSHLRMTMRRVTWYWSADSWQKYTPEFARIPSLVAPSHLMLCCPASKGLSTSTLIRRPAMS